MLKVIRQALRSSDGGSKCSEKLEKRTTTQEESGMYRLFLTTNEDGVERTFKILRKVPVAGDTLVGVSAMYMLNLYAERFRADPQGKHLVIVDKSPAVQRFWKEMCPLMCRDMSRLQTLAKIEQMLREEAKHFWPGDSEASKFWIESMEKEIADGVSWLASDEKFAVVQQLFKERAFLCLPEDITCEGSMRSVNNYLCRRKWTIDGVYASNVQEYAADSILRPGFHAPMRHPNVVDGLQQLLPCMTDGSFVLDTEPREGGLRHLSSLEQRVVKTAKAILGSADSSKVTFPLKF